MMTILRILILFALVGSLLHLNAAEVAGTVKGFTGNGREATLITPDGQSQVLTANMAVPPGSKVKTGPDTKILVQWMSGAYSAIGADTSLGVNALTYSTVNGAPKRKVSLSLAMGSIFSHLAHNDGVSDFRIRTPAGVAAARGTDWSIVVTGTGATTISVVNGTIRVSGRNINVAVVNGTIVSFTVTPDGTTSSTPTALSPADVLLIMDSLNANDYTTNDVAAGLVNLPNQGSSSLSETPLTKKELEQVLSK